MNEIIAALPPEEQAEIDARYQDMKQDVEGLRELRQIAGKAQAEIAYALNIKQPSVSQIERQTDRECLKLCVSDLAHAVFRYGQASKRPANIMAS